MTAKINAHELKQRLSAGEELLILDVREPWEFEEENIGARNIPLSKLPDHINELQGMMKMEIIIHCKSGTRSNQACKYLHKNGFKNTRSLEGGIEAFLEVEA